MQSWNGPRTLPTMERWKMHKHQKTQPHRPIKRILSGLLYLDFQAGFHKEQSEIRLYYEAQFTIFSITDLTSFVQILIRTATKDSFFSALLSLQTGACRIFRKIDHFYTK